MTDVSVEKTLQKTLKFSDCHRVFENKFGQVKENSSNHILFVWSEESNEISRFDRIFGVCSKCFEKELPPLSMFICKPKTIFCRARKGLGTS